MLSTRLARMIEDHAEELTGGLINTLRGHAQTPHYHDLPHDDLHHRIYSVYRNLSQWLTGGAAGTVETSYIDLAKERFAEGIPLSEVIYALILTKYHLREYISYAGLAGSALELYQEQELYRLLWQFFDKAVYYTVCGYECEAAFQHAKCSREGAPT